MLNIEFKPIGKPSLCECCGGLNTVALRYVKENGKPLAFYYARFTEGHSDRFVQLLISFGYWDEHEIWGDRLSFALYSWPSERCMETKVVDARRSPWKDVDLVGTILDRQEALSHPQIQQVWHIVDHILTEDKIIVDYLSKEPSAS